MKYKVYTRNIYKWQETRRAKKRVPDPRARKTTLAYTNSIEEARKICKEYNDTHNPGPLSRKAEFTSNY